MPPLRRRPAVRARLDACRAMPLVRPRLRTQSGRHMGVHDRRRPAADRDHHRHHLLRRRRRASRCGAHAHRAARRDRRLDGAEPVGRRDRAALPVAREVARPCRPRSRSEGCDVRLSVLDQSPISEGSTGAQALKNSIDLARLADALGYHRYWVAEHHGTPMLACASPEALIGPIAAATSRIRVGSGGVMLPHYSPFKVAETFSMLSGLFDNRIDLAVGRAAGTDGLTTFALQRDRRQAAPDDFPEQLVELLGY